MTYDATLKKLFQKPPNRLFSQALGHEISIKRLLPTELITVENLHPDLLFETETGELIHAEIQGYSMSEFPCRNLIYFGLVLRDYHRPPTQVVFWIGPRSVGVTNGLDFPPSLHYRYELIDVRQLDPAFLLDSPDVNESIFAILCKLTDERAIVFRILNRIAALPLREQREAIAQLLILSGLRGLKTLVQEAIQHMPLTIDIHDNEFLEEIYQEGEAKGEARGRLEATRDLLLEQIKQKFSSLTPEVLERIQRAELDVLRRWFQRIPQSGRVEDILD